MRHVAVAEPCVPAGHESVVQTPLLGVLGQDPLRPWKDWPAQYVGGGTEQPVKLVIHVAVLPLMLQVAVAWPMYPVGQPILQTPPLDMDGQLPVVKLYAGQRARTQLRTRFQPSVVALHLAYTEP
jgi:hypothetical protein